MRGLPGRSLTLLVTLAVALVLMAVPGPAASAEQGGSTSRVVGRGDILTTIFGRLKPRPVKAVTVPRRRSSAAVARPKPAPPARSTPPTTAPAPCRDLRLSDGELEWLVAAIGHHEPTPFLQKLSDVLTNSLLPGTPDAAPLDDVEIVVRQCGTELVDAWAVPRATPASIEERLTRTMLTRLPEPVVSQTPPLGAAVPVNEPVFLAIAPEHWHEVRAVLTVAGISAEVRAEPFALRSYSGEPATPFATCPGRGRIFDAGNGLSGRRQAALPDACVIRYRLASTRTDPGAKWIGSVSVLWRAEWRTNGGSWRSLGVIPRTRIFERETVELATAITRTSAPTRAGTR